MIAPYRKKVLQVLHTHLFVMLISLPILIWWGLPLSVMTIIGNIIFAPMLTAFLLVSSLVFFSELLHLPHAWFDYSLECITRLWLWLLQYSSQTWLVSYAQPHPCALALIPLSTFALLHYRANTPLERRVLLFFLLLIGSCWLLWYAKPTSAYFAITSGKQKLTVMHYHGKTLVIDTGALTSLARSRSWINYTFMPLLNKRLGSTTIDYLILLHPTARVFQAATRLCSLGVLHTIYLVWWHGTMPKKSWYFYRRMQEALHQSNDSLIRIKESPITITHDDLIITLVPQNSFIKKTIRYPIVQVHASVDKKPLNIEDICPSIRS